MGRKTPEKQNDYFSTALFSENENFWKLVLSIFIITGVINIIIILTTDMSQLRQWWDHINVLSRIAGTVFFVSAILLLSEPLFYLFPNANKTLLRVLCVSSCLAIILLMFFTM